MAEDQESQKGEGQVGSGCIWGPKDGGWRGQEGKSAINLARMSIVIVIIMKHLQALTLVLAWPGPTNGPINPSHKE